jgi:bacillaene synthase trans-acting acyltransferase
MQPSRALPRVFCFAGQGSQYHHMAAALFREHAVFRQWMLIGDEVVRARHGVSVVDAIYDPARRLADPFDRLEATHPAIFLVQYALAKLLLHHGLRPDRLFGISLGEITAMTLAGMASFEAVLGGVAEQPAVFRRTCAPGGMIAVLGSLALHGALPALREGSEIAGINADEHFVLAAPAAALDPAEAALREREIACQRLPVPFAFHSRWVEPAAAASGGLFAFSSRAPQWPCWSACLAAPVSQDDVADAADLPWRIVRQPMQVRATVQAMEAAGGAIYIDLSPSGTLAAILPQVIRPESPSRALPILSPFGDSLQRLCRVLELAA